MVQNKADVPLVRVVSSLTVVLIRRGIRITNTGSLKYVQIVKQRRILIYVINVPLVVPLMLFVRFVVMHPVAPTDATSANVINARDWFAKIVYLMMIQFAFNVVSKPLLYLFVCFVFLI